MPGGRPRIQIDLKEVEDLAAKGLTQQQIADALGIHVDTLYTRKAEYPEYTEAIKRGQAKGIKQVTNSLFNQAVNEGSIPAAIFYLKNRAGWADKIENKTELSLADDLRSKLNAAINGKETDTDSPR